MYTIIVTINYTFSIYIEWQWVCAKVKIETFLAKGDE